MSSFACRSLMHQGPAWAPAPESIRPAFRGGACPFTVAVLAHGFLPRVEMGGIISQPALAIRVPPFAMSKDASFRCPTAQPSRKTKCAQSLLLQFAWGSRSVEFFRLNNAVTRKSSSGFCNCATDEMGA